MTGHSYIFLASTPHQTNQIYLPPANEVCEVYVFTGVCLSTGGSLWGGSAQGGVCPRGHLCPRGSLSKGSLSRGVSVKETSPGREPTIYGKERAVHILLECILLIFFVTLLWCHSIKFQKRNTVSHEFRTLIHRSPFHICTAHQRSYGKVVFLVMSVYHSVHGGIPCDHYPSCIESHCTGTPYPGPSLVTTCCTFCEGRVAHSRWHFLDW